MIKLTRPILPVFLLLIATGCASTGSRQQDLIVTIRPVTEKWIITDLCHCDDHPPFLKSSSSYFDDDGEIQCPDMAVQEVEEWKRNHVYQADVVVEIKNISSDELLLLHDWNSSTGRYDLKFVFTDMMCQEYWVTKEIGFYYCNCPQSINIKPGESFVIPIVFNHEMLKNFDQVVKHVGQITCVRTLFEQRVKLEDAWYGSVSSPTYSADELVPRFGFRQVFMLESRPSDYGSATESPESSVI